MTAITTVWTESSWAFPESYTANDSWIVRSSDGGQPGDKRAHNSTTKVSFCIIIIRLCHCMIAITSVFGIFVAPVTLNLDRPELIFQYMDPLELIFQ